MRYQRPTHYIQPKKIPCSCHFIIIIKSKELMCYLTGKKKEEEEEEVEPQIS